jgi:hypothetical protein
MLEEEEEAEEKRKKAVQCRSRDKARLLGLSQAFGLGALNLSRAPFHSSQKRRASPPQLPISSYNQSPQHHS